MGERYTEGGFWDPNKKVDAAFDRPAESGGARKVIADYLEAEKPGSLAWAAAHRILLALHHAGYCVTPSAPAPSQPQEGGRVTSVAFDAWFASYQPVGSDESYRDCWLAATAQALATPAPIPPRADPGRECWVNYRNVDGRIVDVSATRAEVKDYDGCKWVHMVEAHAGGRDLAWTREAVEEIRDLCWSAQIVSDPGKLARGYLRIAKLLPEPLDGSLGRLTGADAPSEGK